MTWAPGTRKTASFSCGATVNSWTPDTRTSRRIGKVLKLFNPPDCSQIPW